MTIKQQGGIFGRNPTFNDVDVEGTLTVNGEPISDFGSMAQQDADSVNIDGGAIDGTTVGLTIQSTGDFTTVTGEAVKSGYIADFRNTRSNQDAGGLYVQTRYNNSVNSILKLATNSGSATALEVRGNLDMDVYGSIIMKNSGEGIDFSATSGTGTSELFDDYEEGTWTPTLLTGTATAADAVYTKIGNMVYARATLSSFSDRSTASNVVVSSLPYAPAINSSGGSMFSRYTAVATPVPNLTTGGYVTFYGNSSGNYVQLQHSNLSASASASISFNLVYRA